MKATTGMLLTTAALLGGIDDPLPDFGVPRTPKHLRTPDVLPDLSAGQLRFDRVPHPDLDAMVRVWTWRKGAWRVGEPTPWETVNWRRLLDKDRIEVLGAVEEDEEDDD